MHSCQSLARTGAERLAMVAARGVYEVQCNDFKVHSQSSSLRTSA